MLSVLLRLSAAVPCAICCWVYLYFDAVGHVPIGNIPVAGDCDNLPPLLVGGMRTLFLFDAIGLALFVVVGIEKSFGAGYPAWVAIVMGIITGSFGGVTRDILINEEPLFSAKTSMPPPASPAVRYTGL